MVPLREKEYVRARESREPDQIYKTFIQAGKKKTGLKTSMKLWTKKDRMLSKRDS